MTTRNFDDDYLFGLLVQRPTPGPRPRRRSSLSLAITETRVFCFAPFWNFVVTVSSRQQMPRQRNCGGDKQ